MKTIPEMQELVVPLSDGMVARVPFPMTLAAFKTLKKALALYRPMMVHDETDKRVDFTPPIEGHP